MEIISPSLYLPLSLFLSLFLSLSLSLYLCLFLIPSLSTLHLHGPVSKFVDIYIDIFIDTYTYTCISLLSLSLIKSCKKKNKLYKAYLKSKDPGALEKYKKYKNKLTAILHKSEKIYYTNLLEKHKSNLRETWKIIKELLHRQGSNHNIIPLVINGVTIDDPLMIANNFNN